MSEKLYTVGKIVNHRDTRSGVEYKVHWAGYSSAHDTWEPEENLMNCEEYIQDYIMRTLEKKKGPRRSSRTRRTPSVSTVTSSEEVVEEVIDQVKDAPQRRRTTRQKPKKREPAGVQVEASRKTQPPIHAQQPEPMAQQARSAQAAPSAYRLRSKTSSLAVEYSNEAGRVEEQHQSSEREEMTRMGLSEARFRKHVGQRRFAASTPYSATGMAARTGRLDFDDSQSVSRMSTSTIKSRISHESLSRLTSPASVMSDQKSFIMQGDPEEEVVMEEEEGSDSEETATVTGGGVPAGAGVEAGMEMEEQQLDSPPAWLQLTWKECVLASFLSGMVVVGYLCYCSDYCHYC